MYVFHKSISAGYLICLWMHHLNNILCFTSYLCMLGVWWFMFMWNVCGYVLDWVSDGAMFWFGVKTHLRKMKVLGNKVKNRFNSMRIHLNRTDLHQMTPIWTSIWNMAERGWAVQVTSSALGIELVHCVKVPDLFMAAWGDGFVGFSTFVIFSFCAMDIKDTLIHAACWSKIYYFWAVRLAHNKMFKNPTRAYKNCAICTMFLYENIKIYLKKIRSFTTKPTSQQGEIRLFEILQMSLYELATK